MLFADLAGSTALGERLDPGGRARRCRASSSRWSTPRSSGSAASPRSSSATRSWPSSAIPQSARGRSRSARCARRSRRTTGSRASPTDRRAATALDVGLRIGVNTGEVVARPRGRGARRADGQRRRGERRRAAAAGAPSPGEVLVGERTQRGDERARSRTAREPRDRREGQERAVAAWVAAVAAVEPTQPRGAGGLSAPFIGRDEELAMLTALVARASPASACRSSSRSSARPESASRGCSPSCSSGLPDARVLQGAVPAVRRGHHVLAARRGGEDRTRAILDTDPVDAALEKLRAAIESVVGRTRRATSSRPIAWTIGLDAARARRSHGRPEYADALAGRVAAIPRRRSAASSSPFSSSRTSTGRRQPLLDLLEQLADTLAETRVLIVCTARPELLELRPTWGAGKQNATTLTLAAAARPRSPRELVLVAARRGAGCPSDVARARAERARRATRSSSRRCSRC